MGPQPNRRLRTYYYADPTSCSGYRRVEEPDDDYPDVVVHDNDVGFDIVPNDDSCCMSPAVSPCVFAAVVFGAIMAGFIAGAFLVWFGEDRCAADLPPIAAAAIAIRGRTCIRTSLIYPAACYVVGSNTGNPHAIVGFISGVKNWANTFNGLATGYTAGISVKNAYSADLIIVANTTAPISCTHYSSF